MIWKTDETGRLCRMNLAVHGLEGDIRHGGNVNSYYDAPHARNPQRRCAGAGNDNCQQRHRDTRSMNEPKDSKGPNPPAKGQFLVYQAEDGRMRIDVRLENETAWLPQSPMAELFQTTIPNVSMHIRNVFAEGELQADSVIQEFSTTAATTQTEEGRKEVKRGGDSEDMNATPLFVSFPNPNGIVSISPGLRGTSYPGLMERDASTPTGLCQAGRAMGPNPFRLDDVCFTIPQGSSFLATLGFGPESRWDSVQGSPKPMAPAASFIPPHGLCRQPESDLLKESVLASRLYARVLSGFRGS
jgi:hypothetical protein